MGGGIVPRAGRRAPSKQILATLLLLMLGAIGGSRAGSRIEVHGPAASGSNAAPEALVRSGLVLVSAAELADVNGDRDGFADTNETVELLLAISNKSLQDLTGVVVHVATTDPKIDCIENSAIAVGNLGAASEVFLAQPFRMHVSSLADRGGPAVTCTNPGGTCSNFVQRPGGCGADADCRLTPLDEYAVTLQVVISSDQFPVQGRPQSVTLDLDLDAMQPAGPITTFADGFESGFGNFSPQSLDTGQATNALSDGKRCQYNDPDNPDSYSFGDPMCYLGFASGANLNDWHLHATSSPDGGRAFLGTRSAHFGTHPGGVDTMSMSQMDLLRSRVLNLAARICRDDPATDKRACSADADCLASGGGPCVGARPELTFKQQTAMIVEAGPSRHPADKAVVQAQITGATAWTKLFPYRNVYDEQPWAYSNCSFDPVDDGNSEDLFFVPYDPSFPAGPSSTCYPEFVFNHLGSTEGPFGAGNVANASDGPGLQGSLGPGTWVESRFDLSRYRGRSIRLRFLISTLKDADTPTYEALFMWNPEASDDGWYIDDVQVSQTLGAATPTVTSDIADNSALPADGDGDGAPDLCDCAPGNGTAFALPPEASGLAWSDPTTLAWSSLAPMAGSGTHYDVLRGLTSEFPVGSGPSELCLAPDVASTTRTDPSAPGAGRAFYYLVRGRNACGVGTYGATSGGTQRTSGACP